MTPVLTTKYYHTGLIALYHLMIEADGHVSPKEIEMGELMREQEKISTSVFNYTLSQLSNEDKETILNKCLESLKNCEHELKIKCVAWMSLIANSDGFMDASEWSLIYRIYAKELNLKLDEIMNVQRGLSRAIAHLNNDLY